MTEPVLHRWLSENRHLRYMWLPYTDTVVVVQANPLGSGSSTTSSGSSSSSPASAAVLTEEQKLAPMAGVALKTSPRSSTLVMVSDVTSCD